MKKKLLLGLLFSSTLLLSACYGGDKKDSGGAQGNEEMVYNLIVPQELPTADPSLSTDVISSAAINNIFEGLYRLNPDHELEPAGAAEMATVSDDGLVYQLKLREDAKWSNGDPVVADDYVYGWQRSVDPKTQSEYAYLFAPVKNGQAILDEKAKPSDLGIKAVNDHELEITLEQPTPYFDYLLAFSTFYPQNQAVVEKYGKEYLSKSDKGVYNGAFTLEDFDGPGSDTEWTYKKNPNYWDAKNVELDKISVTAVKEPATALNLFNDGQADDVILTGELAQQNEKDPAYQVMSEASTRYLEFNQRKPDSPLNNVNLRKAISYAIDRDALTKQVLKDGSFPSTGIVPKDLSKDPKTNEDFAKESGEWVSYNQDEAKKAWEQAKKELGTDTVSFDLISSDDDSTKSVTTFIQNAIQKNLDGVKVNLTPVPFSVRLDRTSAGDFDVVYSGWAADYLDPSNFLDLFVTGNSYNRGQWSNQKYDELIKAAQTTDATNPETRWKDFIDAQKVIMDEMGVVPLFQQSEAHLINQKFTNVVHHPAGAKWDYKWVKVSK